jgi:hypothetical protein
MSDQHDQRMATIFRAQDVSVVTPETLKRMLAQHTAHQDRRIADIFGQDKVPKVTEATLAIYRAYLTQHLAMPCLLTGIEDRGCFAWETSYIFGPGNKQEYAQRKKKQASYTDTYALLRFEDAYDVDDGLMVTVRRVSDKKRFALPLKNLKATEGQSSNAQLLHDYVVWFVNWRAAESLQTIPDPGQRMAMAFALIEKQSNQQLPDIEKFPVHYYEDGITSFENTLRLRQIVAFEHWQGHTDYTLGDVIRKVSAG